MPGADGSIGPASRGVRDLEALRLRLERELRRLLLALDTERGSDALVSDKQAIANAARVLRQVERALVDEGVGVVASVVAKRAEESLGAVDVDVPVDARAELRAIVSGQVRDVTSVFREAQDQIAQAVNAGITTGTSLADLVDVVAERLGTATVRAQAAVDAAIMAVGRRAVVAAAEEGIDAADLVFLYVGPVDRKTRPFCRALVGKAVSPARMRALDNGQQLPAADFCGGYGCRHSWAPMERADADAEGIAIVE